MVKPWEDATGVKVNYTGQRDLGTALTTGIARRHPPRPGRPSRPGPMAAVVQGRRPQAARLRRLRDLRGSTPHGLRGPGQGTGRQARRHLHQGRRQGPDLVQHRDWTRRAPPKTWDDLRPRREPPRPGRHEGTGASASSPAATPGWPGTDWIEDIVLRQSGTDVYDAVVRRASRSGPRPEIKRPSRLRRRRRQHATAARKTVNRHQLRQGGDPMFTTPPGCLFHHQASFITDFFKNEARRASRPTTTSSRSRTSTRPTPARSTGAGDLFGMFNDTPQARSLIAYLRTPEPRLSGSSAAAPSRPTRTSTDLPGRYQKRSAEILSQRQDLPVRRLRPDAERDEQGVLPGASSSTSRTRADLDSILANLDTVQADRLQP